MEIIKLNATTLIDALSQSIKIAGEPNEDNFDSVCLKIYSDGTYSVMERCYKNTSYSSLVPIRLDSTNIVVSKNDYPGKNWPFDLVEFCSMYGIRTSNRTVEDCTGKQIANNWK